MKSTLEIFSENLRNKLIARRKTQADLAKYMNVTQASVSRWVNGSAMPRPAMIDKICVFLNCTADELTIDHSKPVAMLPQDIIAEEIESNPKLMRLMFYFMKMPDEELDKEIERLSK